MHLAELPSGSELGEVTSADVLMTRRNVASYDCRSDVSAGLPGIAYVIFIVNLSEFAQLGSPMT
jgi:hypothetical protein